jgi:ATP synthase protein I
MDDDRPQPGNGGNRSFVRQVGSKADRKLLRQRAGTSGIWFGLGVSGLIGWSVTVPTFLGAVLGVWLDRHHPGAHSWTLALLVAGLIIGCANAWHWVSRQDRAMHEHNDDHD